MPRRSVFPLAVVAAIWAASIAIVAQRARGPGAVTLAIELPDNPAAGARLFMEKRCVRCHALGPDEPRIGPDLSRMQFKGSVLDFAGALWNHAPMMREKMADLKIQPPELTSRELADLLAFLTAYRYYLTELGQPGNPVAGKRLFDAKGCSSCHGDRAAWEKPGPSLDRYRGRFSAIYLAQAMWNHGPEMADLMRRRGVPWPTFAGREMGDLLAYLQAGNSAAALNERVYFEPGSPRRGQTLFAEKRCSTCHAIAGTGGRRGPDLGAGGRELVRSVSEIAGLMWNHNREMAAAQRRGGIARVTFSGQEMADIISYLYFVNYANVTGVPARGRRLFADKCSTCHSVGGGRRAGPDLRAIPQVDNPIALFANMWNHAQGMEQEARKRGQTWPRLEPGDAADLAAFLLPSR